MKNVVLLTIDALRKDTLGCYGNNSGLTPFLDSLQNKSILFTKGQASGPYTQASFPGILTSSYFLDYGKPKSLSPQRTIISTPLKQAGIFTAAFHSNPYLCGFLGWNRDWDVFYDSMEDEVDGKIPYIKGHVINSKVDEWLTSYTRSGEYRPFFLWLHYMDVHEPYIPQRKYIDMVDPYINISQNEMFNLFEEVLLKRDISDKEMVKLLKKLYDANVREVDDYVKEFFGILDKNCLLENTIVIITNDHGDEFGEHGGLSHDDKMYAELIDMPLLIYFPNKSNGDVFHTLVSSVDIAPTITYLFGLKPVEDFKGYSLLPLENYPEKGAFGEAIEQRSQRGGNMDKDSYFYREKDLKVIYHADTDTWELYDLEEDPRELNNTVNKSLVVDALKIKLKPMIRRWQK